MLIINSRFLTQQLTGVQRFAIEISKQIKKKLGDKVLFVAPRNIVNKEAAKELQAVIVGKHTGYLWEQWDLMQYMKSNGGHLLSLCGFAPVLYKDKSWVLHDIQSVRFPQMFTWKIRLVYGILMPAVLRTSKHVFSVSNFSMNEISSHYNIPLDKMSVVYNATSDIFRKVENSNLANKKYLFAVSSVKANKNFPVVLKAFENVSNQCPDLHLYIAGNMNSKLFADVDISRYQQNERIHFVGHIDDQRLVELYSNAFALLFPSFYEGFGLPIVEAQACGCPVICSDASSLPEVARDSALYGNPDKVEDFEHAIIKLYNDDTLRNQLIEKGYENIKRFNWSLSADNLLKELPYR